MAASAVSRPVGYAACAPVFVVSDTAFGRASSLGWVGRFSGPQLAGGSGWLGP